MSLPSTRYLYQRWPFFYMKRSWMNSLRRLDIADGIEICCSYQVTMLLTCNDFIYSKVM